MPSFTSQAKASGSRFNVYNKLSVPAKYYLVHAEVGQGQRALPHTHTHKYPHDTTRLSALVKNGLCRLTEKDFDFNVGSVHSTGPVA